MERRGVNGEGEGEGEGEYRIPETTAVSTTIFSVPSRLLPLKFPLLVC